MLFLDFDEPITENVTFKVSITQMSFETKSKGSYLLRKYRSPFYL